MPQAPTVAVPKRWPLVISPENRYDSTAKDARLVNCFIERKKGQEDVQIYRRPGLLLNFSNSGLGFGLYNWKGAVYSVFGSTLYKNNVAIPGVLDTTGGVHRFSSTLGATPRLVLGNGVKAYTFDGTTLAQIVDADFPAAFVKGWAYLNGTTYVTTPSASVQGSDINDPTSWDPLNVLIAQIEPDGGVATAKQLVYNIILKQWTTEVFYDASNSVGSPLGSVQGAKVSFGCVSQDSVQEIDDILFWVCTNRSSSPQVLMMDKLKADIISTPAVERLLAHADFTTTFSWTIKLNGHAFYVLTVKAANLTLAYDMTEKEWAQWTDAAGNYVPIVASTFDSTMHHVVQHETNGKLYFMDSIYLGDDGVAIPVDIYTPNFDGGVRRFKHVNMLTVISDRVTGSNLSIRCNDNDYNPTGWTNYQVADLGLDDPRIAQEGSFLRRAYNLHHEQLTDFRLSALEYQVDIGTN